MASFARDIQTYKYYCKEFGNKQAIDALLSAEKKQQKSRIPYFFSTSKEFPGKFVLSYMPRTKGIHEYVTVTPNGIRYRSKVSACVQSDVALHEICVGILVSLAVLSFVQFILLSVL